MGLWLTLWPINSGVLTSLLLPHLSASLTDSLPSLNLLCHSKTDAQFMQDAPKAVWSIPYVSVAFFSSLKQNSIAYRSSKVSSHPDCIFKIHQLWQSGFSRVSSSSCCSCSFEPEIIRIGQSSHKILKCWVLSKEASSTIFWVFGMTWPGIELRSPRPLGNTLTIMPKWIESSPTVQETWFNPRSCHTKDYKNDTWYLHA